ncbi:MAG TPA: AAA family ATPase [Gaiellaceae bacterium]|nr:AAA family ATPase [Gaiellaceae bacterium]
MAVTAPLEQLGLLERDDMLEELRLALAEASAGRGRLVLIAGEAGVGKTAVVQALCDKQSGNIRIFRGACDPLFTPRPLGPFMDIADDAGGELAKVLEAGGSAHELVSALLAETSGRRPAIVVLEDVHWADEATLDALRLLARRVDRAAVLVLVTYRDDSLDRMHPLRAVIGELATRAPVDRISIEPLSQDAVEMLAADAEVDAAELYRKTGGNPFFVIEVLAAGNGAIPPTVRDAVLARAGRLSESARNLLEAVAIAPPHVDVPLLEALAGKDAAALDQCLAAGMLTASSSTVEFRHELTRLSIEESIEPRRRLFLHRRALAALSNPPSGEPDAARLAHHAEAAGDAEAVLRYAPAAAARASALRAHREAAGQYARALRFAESLDLEGRAQLLERYSDACYLTDRCYDAIDAVEAALEVYRSTGNRVKEGELLSLLSQLQMCPASTVVAEPAGRRAIEVLEELPPSPALAMAYANLAAIRMNMEDAPGTARWADKAIELAERLDETVPLVHALNSLGTMEFLRHGPEHRQKVERSLELARNAGLEVHVLRAHGNMAWAAVHHHAHDLAEHHHAEGLAIAAEPDYDLWRLNLLATRSLLELEQGRWDEAAESATFAMSDPRSSPLPRILGSVVLGLARARRGDPSAKPLLEEALALAAPSGELQRIAPASAARAELAWLTGDAGAINELTAPALSLAVERGAAWYVGQLACWRRRAGLDEPVAIAVPEPHALELAGNAEEAAEAWERLGCPYDAALARAASDAVDTIRRAHDELVELGAHATAAVVARRLRERGVRGIARGPRAATRANAASLTERELDVLRLMSDGLSNAAIAERLFLSVRTVHHHVSAILRKLDVGRRGEAVAEAHRLALLQDP